MYKIKTYSILIFLFLSLSIKINGQGSAGDRAYYELTSLIDLPTTGILKKGDLGVGFDIQHHGTLITKVELAIIKNLMLGFSYGGSNIIGTGKPNFYLLPTVNFKFRLFTETRSIPSFTIGFNSQGKGLNFGTIRRYEIKSPGAFFAISKNYKLFGYLTLHGVLNYYFERDDGDENINLGIGFEKTVGPTISIIAEYDFAINDDSNNSLGDGKGYLNFGIRWSASESLTLGLDFRNLTNNKKHYPNNSGERALNIQYIINLY